MKHATCPTVCTECRAKIETLALTGSSPIMHVCTHTALSLQVIVVMAHARNCTIVQWDVHGPMPPARAQSFVEDAQAMVAAQIAAARAG